MSVKLTTSDMEVALTQDRKSPVCFLTKPVVVNKCQSVFGHETDLVGISDAGYCTEIEIKISKSDFIADLKKRIIIIQVILSIFIMRFHII